MGDGGGGTAGGAEGCGGVARRGDGEGGGDERGEEARARGEAAGEELGVGLPQVVEGFEASKDFEQLLLHWWKLPSCGEIFGCSLFPADF